jgi:hypothetical protein
VARGAVWVDVVAGSKHQIKRRLAVGCDHLVAEGGLVIAPVAQSPITANRSLSLTLAASRDEGFNKVPAVTAARERMVSRRLGRLLRLLSIGSVPCSIFFCSDRRVGSAMLPQLPNCCNFADGLSWDRRVH